jgi:copper(I)-binding protein
MNSMARSLALTAAVSLLVGSLVSCSKTDTASTENRDQGSSVVTVADQWVKAAPSGMTAVFGTLKNSGAKEVTVVSASSPVAGEVELHEVVGQPGSTTMRPKDDGFAIPGGGSHVLAPGGDHIMLMDLKGPLQAGAEVEVTLSFNDGSSLPFSAQVRDFEGAAENYQPGGHSAGSRG